MAFVHRQCPVSYNNSYAYGLTTLYIIAVIVDPSVGLCTYVLVMDVLSYLVGLYLLVLTWITYLLVRMYWYLLGLLTYLYLLTELVHFTASLTGGVNNQPVAFGDTGGVNNQPVDYSDTDGVNRTFAAF